MTASWTLFFAFASPPAKQETRPFKKGTHQNNAEAWITKQKGTRHIPISSHDTLSGACKISVKMDSIISGSIDLSRSSCMSSSTSGEMADAPLSDDEDDDLLPAADGPVPAGARFGPRAELLSESALLSSVKLSIARLARKCSTKTR